MQIRFYQQSPSQLSTEAKAIRAPLGWNDGSILAVGPNGHQHQTNMSSSQLSSTATLENVNTTSLILGIVILSISIYLSLSRRGSKSLPGMHTTLVHSGWTCPPSWYRKMTQVTVL